MNKINTKKFPSSILKNRGDYNLLITYSEIKEHIINNLSNTNNIKIKNNQKEYNILEKNINKLLKLKIYNNLSNYTTENTLNYLFNHMRNAIYVKIRNNKVVGFQPFANYFYKNNWSHNINFDNSNNIHEYIKHKSQYFNIYTKYMINHERWWCNNILINNEERKDIWGSHSLNLYKEILDETCINHTINDIDIFINKRDHPMLKKDLTEPYDKLFETVIKLHDIYQNKSYTPILSPYVDNKYADIPFIIPADWKLIQDDYEYKILNDISWENKIETAFFRGSATGYSSLKNNQRLQIALLSQQMFISDHTNLLDAGIVSFNPRDKIDDNMTLNFIKPNKLNIKLVNKIPMNEQIKYKYILSISGHSGGVNRISWILQSGCLWIKVEPLNIIDATDSWYTSLLIENIHYISIKADLSNLQDKILWCRNNDDKCKEIMENAKKIYNEYFTKKGLMKYTAYILNSINI